MSMIQFMLQKENINAPNCEPFQNGLSYRPHDGAFIVNNMRTKQCTKCKEHKSISAFGKNTQRKTEFKSWCKECTNIQIKEYFHTKRGLSIHIYHNQKHGSKYRNYPLPNYTKEDFIEWLYSLPLFHELYENWKLSGYNKDLAPSVDRKDDYLSYTLDNIQLMTWEQNRTKGHNDQKNGINNKNSKSVIATHIITGKIIHYYSMNKASRQTGIDCGNISKCCLGKIKTLGGYVWSFRI